jgi:hypothetical protein
MIEDNQNTWRVVWVTEAQTGRSQEPMSFADAKRWAGIYKREEPRRVVMIEDDATGTSYKIA